MVPVTKPVYLVFVDYLLKWPLFLLDWFRSTVEEHSDKDSPTDLPTKRSLYVLYKNGVCELFIESGNPAARLEDFNLIPEFKVSPYFDEHGVFEGLIFYVKSKGKWLEKGEIIDLGFNQ